MKAIASIALSLLACITVATARTWNTSAATTDAERDIAAHKIKFCVWGGYAPQLVGVPERYRRLVNRYPRIMVGQGCIVSDATLDQRQRAYAVAYNTHMLNYVLHERQ
jgi:hypothetical protein